MSVAEAATTQTISPERIEDLDNEIVETIAEKAIYFPSDIAEHLGITHGLANERLGALEAAGRVEKEGGGYFAVEDYVPSVSVNGSKAPEKKSVEKPDKNLWPVLDPDSDDYDFDTKGPDKSALKRIAEIKVHILEAIDAKHRSFPSIKTFIGAPDAFDLNDVLEDMQADFIIRKWDVGKIWAFFRYETLPKRAWMLGAGQVDAEWDETFQPRDEKKKREELANGKKADRNGSEGAAKKQSKEINADELYFAALEATNFEEIAEQLDASTFYLQMCIDKDPELKAALNRGIEQNDDYSPTKPTQKAAAAKSGSDTPVAAAPPPPADRRPKGIVYTAEIFRDAASRGWTKAKLARQLNVGGASIDFQLEKAEFATAWEEGVQIFSRGGVVQTDDVTRTGRGGRVDIDLEKLEELAAEGKSEKEIAEKLGMGFSTLQTKKATHLEIRDALIRGKTAAGRKPSGGKYDWSESLFREAGRKGLTYREIADEAGCHYSTVHKILEAHPEYRKAFDEAVEMRKADPAAGPVAPAAKRTDGKSGKSLAYTTDDLEEAAAMHGNTKDIAEALGYTGEFRNTALGTFCRRHSEYGAALKRGVARYEEQNLVTAAAENLAVEHENAPEKEGDIYASTMKADIESLDARPKSTPIRNLTPSRIEMVLEESDIEKPVIVPPPNVPKTEIVIKGGRVAVEIDVNLLVMNSGERAALMELIDAVQKFGAL